MNIALYSLVLFCWGTSWLAITFQLGEVAPQVSIAWRFLIASLILFGWCFIRGINLSFPWRSHLSWIVLGIFLFSVNYICIYFGSFYLASGLVALIFSTLTLFTVFNGFIFFKYPIRWPILIGGLVGIAGLAVIFSNEIRTTVWSLESGVVKGFIWVLVGTFFASIGTLLSGEMQARKMPLVQSNAFGMLYGSLLIVAYTGIGDIKFGFDVSYSYIVSLISLALFASVLGFGAYLKLVGNIGADKASYVFIFTPVIALLLSTLFEDYQWSQVGLVGVMLIIVGNVLVLFAKTKTVARD